MSAQRRSNVNTNADYVYINEDQIDSELKCIICQQPFVKPMIGTKCGHTFCQECIQNWYSGNSSCPSCRQKTSFQPLMTRIVLNQLDRLLVRCSYCNKNDIERGNFHDHINRRCSEVRVKCPAADMKCKWVGKQNEQAQHSVECPLVTIRPIIAELQKYFATRIYICSLIIIIIIITITTALVIRPVNKTEYSPSSKRFIELTSKYPNNIHCPCTKVGISYDTFVTTHVQFHQVCSSQFIKQKWIDMMFYAQNITFISSGDFRTRLIFFWQLIAGFCMISNRIWTEIVISFNATQTLSQVAISEDLLRIRVDEDLNKQVSLFQMALANNLRSMRETIRGNQMVSGLATNFYLRYSIFKEIYHWLAPQMSPQKYNNCTCLNIAGCSHSATFNDSHNHSITIPGMISDCLILDGTLASTFECYYNQTCLSILHESLSIILQPLSNDSNKHFLLNTTIEMLLNKIMIDEMTSTIRFDSYYFQCHPSYCAYSYVHRLDVLFIITTLFGILGGLSFILKFISPFIVTIILQSWLDYVTSLDPIDLPYVIVFTDFRASGAWYFQLLAIFCTLTERYLKDAQDIFINTRFINTHILSSSIFMQQTAAIIESYIDGMQNDFQRSIDYIKIGLSSNQILTGTNTNFRTVIDENDMISIRNAYFHAIYRIDGDGLYAYGDCQCGLRDSECFGWNFIFPNMSNKPQNEYYFPYIPVGCIPLIGFLASTFSWWYDKTYFDHIQTSYAAIINSKSVPKIEQLDRLIMTRFYNKTMEELLREMFVEKWITNNTDFKQFYNACAPIFCSYTIIQRRDIIVLLLLLISIGSGLNKILRIFIPFIGKVVFFFIDYCKNRGTQHVPYNLVTRLKHLFSVIYNLIININLYKTEPTNVQLQKTYTRIYALLFTSSLIILLFYNAIIERSITKTYTTPSIINYEYLLSIYSENVNCPCTYIAIPYDKFITELRVNTFHQDEKYRISSDSYPARRYLSENDFRNNKLMFVKVLRQLCTLAQKTVEDSITTFLISSMFVKQMISYDQFHIEINDIINQFKKKISLEFARTLSIIRIILQGNALVGHTPSNWRFVVNKQNQENNTSFHTEPVYYINSEQNTSCSCITQQTCTMPAMMYEELLSMPLEGFKLGCSILETVLLSSLSCLYSRICIKQYTILTYKYDFLEKYFNGTNEVIQLNSSLTRFHINDTIEIMANEICAPNYCIYKYYYRFDAFELVTIFLSVYTGVSTIIQFINIAWANKLSILNQIPNQIRFFVTGSTIVPSSIQITDIPSLINRQFIFFDNWIAVDSNSKVTMTWPPNRHSNISKTSQSISGSVLNLAFPTERIIHQIYALEQRINNTYSNINAHQAAEYWATYLISNAFYESNMFEQLKNNLQSLINDAYETNSEIIQHYPLLKRIFTN
ncbi:hypothetical protein I4U23_005227 [Adineta vaga]|nr:hypothetical protein I4U23_005227 [Adineta vaga]